MNWAEAIQLIIAVGLPAAEKIWQKVASGKDPTQADWDELRALTNQKASDQMLTVLKAQNIDPASDAGKAFLALVT